MGTQKGIFPCDWWAVGSLSLSPGEGGPCCFHAENFIVRPNRAEGGQGAREGGGLGGSRAGGAERLGAVCAGGRGQLGRTVALRLWWAVRLQEQPAVRHHVSQEAQL